MTEWNKESLLVLTLRIEAQGQLQIARGKVQRTAFLRSCLSAGHAGSWGRSRPKNMRMTREAGK